MILTSKIAKTLKKVEVLICDQCRKELTDKPYFSCKIVIHDELASTPIMWGDWCSIECLAIELDTTAYDRKHQG